MVDDPTICLYGVSYNQNLPEIETTGDFNILAIHADIANEAAYPGHDYSAAKTFLRLHKDFDLILCGHIHRKFAISDKNHRMILNSGPMLRDTADEYNFEHKPGFYVFDTTKPNGIEWIRIPHEPAENVLSRTHLETQKQINGMMSQFIVGMDAEFESGVEFPDNLELFIKANEIEKSVVKKINETMGRE